MADDIPSSKTQGDQAKDKNAQSPSILPGNTPDHVADTVRKQILATLAEGYDQERLAGLITLWSSAAGAAKAEREQEKLRLEIDQLRGLPTTAKFRFWAPILAPLLSSIAVAATLLFQIYSFNLTLARQQKLDEASQFRKALDGSQLSPALAQSANAIVLKSFLKSPTQAADAREVSLFLLSRGKATIFNTLYPAVFEHPDDKSLPELRAVCGSILLEYRDPDPSETETFLHKARVFGKIFEQILRTSPHPKTDLSNSILWGTNLSDLNLSGFIIREAVVNGALFTGVTSFENSEWTGTAWWRAKSLSGPLFEYLKRQFPYNPSVSYAGDKATAEEYAKELERLKP